MLTVLACIFVFGILVTVHEFGHFITAKLTGMKVEEFSIGFGPNIYQQQEGETLYSLRMLPLGGYNKIAGMDPEDPEDLERGFNSKPVTSRMLVILAGSLMNFILPVLIFFGIFLAYGMEVPQNTPVLGQIVEGYPFPCDVGRFNDKNFVYVAAFGLFTDVSYETNQGLKNIFGQAAYIMEGVKRISKLTKYHVKVTCDDQIIEDDFVVGMVTNSKSVGGFRSLIGSKVYFDDGQFEVTLIKYPRNLNEMRLIVNSLLSGKLDPEHIYQLRASKIVFESWDDISWTRDGEYGGTFQTVEIENLQQAVRIMVNEEHLKAVASDKTQVRRLD